MKVHYPKLNNMAHLVSLNVFAASKGSNNFILLIFILREHVVSRLSSYFPVQASTQIPKYMKTYIM